jgi:phenylpropionate dioxygenase-like ring-hydroxylating dioxygenase large terminal subunit
MSDLAAPQKIAPAKCQLPVAWYFDPAVFAREQKTLFENGPQYVGHECMLPGLGDYRVLSWMDDAKVLVRNASGIELLSNVCRHRQATLLEGAGRVDNIVCPLHRWTYDLRGNLLGAPHFAENPCLRLASTPLADWHGLLFTGPRDPRADLVDLPVAGDFDFSGYALDRLLVDDVACNWKTFLEVYLELYHVDPFHPGLGNFADCGAVDYAFGKEWSVQIVGAKHALARPGTPAYRRWQEACVKALDGAAPKYGALWMAYFPGVMLEWYPNVLVVSHLLPLEANRTRNVVEFYYPEEIALFERDFVEAQQAAYLETAAEDSELCLRMERGRRALYRQGLDDAGPYQSPMEDAEVHFHEWLHERMSA